MPQVALTIWGSRISPVYESASQIRVVYTHNDQVVRQTDMPLPPHPISRICVFCDQGIQVLICGAISGLQASMIRGRDIRLIPFITGQARDVLTAFMHGNLGSEQFAMPGCLGRQRRRRRRGRNV
ncbi:MAG: hypothetical protein R6V55_08020 [Desulfovermiculus sp.]